jgi:hypothetical protein
MRGTHALEMRYRSTYNAVMHSDLCCIVTCVIESYGVQCLAYDRDLSISVCRERRMALPAMHNPAERRMTLLAAGSTS